MKAFRPQLSVFFLFAGALAAAPAPNSRPAAQWKLSATLAAPEANQAAAADEKFVYAIASASIAKYDRATGERVALSTGKAQHLNSGFFHEGRLYCAHSNYPKKPELSQIMVLDTESMKIEVFKDFGNFGGSLTWVIHHEGHWWCCFARYGKENSQTFMVKFDDRWKELARWTLPDELVKQLGNYSLSGGVWRDGLLVVTGHDAPVLYRLRIPREGTVLELVDQQKAPLSGQGLAHDGKTGGLVGINRNKRQVVFLTLDRELRD